MKKIVLNILEKKIHPKVFKYNNLLNHYPIERLLRANHIMVHFSGKIALV